MVELKTVYAYTHTK